ncbi:hypothetical protein QM806_41090, partial [Rhodococcus sp. IEGM 1351]|nr:hypothetical protein [Rhodococcus sp. IEGM 1351]
NAHLPVGSVPAHCATTPSPPNKVLLGHPVGATGSRIMTTLLHELKRRGGRYGLETMCIGGGQGIAAVFESI